MGLMRLAEITAEFPYDGIETEDQMDFVQFPGIGVSTAIGEMLVALGCQVTAPEHLGLHGWAFDVTRSDDKYYAQVSDIGDYIILELEVPFRIFHKARDARFADILNGLHDLILKDPRFTSIGWYRDGKDYSRGKSPAPTPAG